MYLDLDYPAWIKCQVQCVQLLLQSLEGFSYIYIYYIEYNFLINNDFIFLVRQPKSNVDGNIDLTNLKLFVSQLRAFNEHIREYFLHYPWPIIPHVSFLFYRVYLPMIDQKHSPKSSSV